VAWQYAGVPEAVGAYPTTTPAVVSITATMSLVFCQTLVTNAYGPPLVLICVNVTVCPAIVMVAVRTPAVPFAVADQPTDPEPVPEAPEVIVNHVSEDDAVHAKSGALVVTVMEPVEPAAGTLTAVGRTVRDPTTPPWVTVKVFPAIVRCPIRVAVFGFAVMEKPTLPFPVPLAPEVTVNQGASLVAVHGQFGSEALTPTEPVAPDTGAVTPLPPIRKEHGKPSCLTETVVVPAVTIAVRDVTLGFCAIEKPKVPLPFLFAPEVIVSHGESLDAVQVQPGRVVTPAVPVPPAAETSVTGKFKE
jgi:hypothetical protein